jgi:hypothetical protein
MTYVKIYFLILIIGNSNAVTSQTIEFHGKEACEQARQAILEETRIYRWQSAVCVAKSGEEAHDGNH